MTIKQFVFLLALCVVGVTGCSVLPQPALAVPAEVDMSQWMQSHFIAEGDCQTEHCLFGIVPGQTSIDYIIGPANQLDNQWTHEISEWQYTSQQTNAATNRTRYHMIENDYYKTTTTFLVKDEMIYEVGTKLALHKDAFNFENLVAGIGAPATFEVDSWDGINGVTAQYQVDDATLLRVFAVINSDCSVRVSSLTYFAPHLRDYVDAKNYEWVDYTDTAFTNAVNMMCS